MDSYYFPDQHIIVAYHDNQFIGVLITYPNETVTMTDLLAYFGVGDPTYFMAEKIPLPMTESQAITPENYKGILSDFIEIYMKGGEAVFDKPDVIHIPRTIH